MICHELGATHTMLIRFESANPHSEGFPVTPGHGWAVLLRGFSIVNEATDASRWSYAPQRPDECALHMLVESLARAMRGREPFENLVEVMRVTVARHDGDTMDRVEAERAVAGFLGDEIAWVHMETPACPRCGSDRFIEDRIVRQGTRLSFDADLGSFKYGASANVDSGEIEGIRCAACNMQLPPDYLEGWIR